MRPIAGAGAVRNSTLVAAALAFGVLLAARPCAAQLDGWASPPFLDTLRFSSLPINGYEAATPPAGVTELSVASGYFNVWQLTWHTKTIHRVLGLYNSPLTDAQVKLIEQEFPHDQFYHIAIEGTRTDVLVRHGFGDGYAATLCIPWVDIGQPEWDAIAEDFHRFVGLSNVGRQYFPHWQTAVVVRGKNGTIERLSGLDGSGIGDTSLSLTGPLGQWLGGEHQWVAAIEAPTGARDTLRGSGGWDWGLRWFGTWSSGASKLRVGLGYSWLDPGGSWLGVKRDNLTGALIEGATPLSRVLTLRASARFDSSPLASFTSSGIGGVSFYWTLGLLADTGRGTWVAFDGGEHVPSSAEVPDFSLHLQFGTHL